MKPFAPSTFAVLILLAANPVAMQAAERPTGFIPLGYRPLVALTKDEGLLAHWSAESKSRIGLIETAGGKQRTGLPVPDSLNLLHLQFAHDTGFLYAVSDTGKAVVWKGREAPQVVQLEGVNQLSGTIAVDKQGKRLIYAGKSDVSGQTGAAWNLTDGALIHSWSGDPAIGAAFSHDGSQGVIAEEQRIKSYDFDSDEESQVTELNKVAREFLVSSTGRYICLIGSERATILDTVTMKTDYVEASPGVKVMFSPKDDRLVVAHSADRGRRIEVWSLRGGIRDLALEKEVSGRLADPVGLSATALVFHTREDKYALRVEEFSELRHKLIGYDSGVLRQVVGSGYDAAVSMLSINHDGTLIACGLAGQTVALWTTAAPIHGFREQKQRNAPRVPEMRTADRCLGMARFDVAASSGQFVGNQGALLLTFIDGTKGVLPTSLAFPQDNLLTIRYRDWQRSSSRELSDMDFSPRGDKLAVALLNGVSIAEVSTGRELQFFPHSSFFAKFDSRGEKVFCVGRSQHGVASLTTRNYISMRDFGTPSPATPGGRIATGFRIQGEPVALDVDAGRQVRTFAGREVRSSFGNTAVSEDGRTFILAGTVKRAGSGRDMVQLEIYDIASGDLKVSMQTEALSVPFLFILNDSQTAVVGTRHRVAVYDTRRRRVLQIIPDEKYRDDGRSKQQEIRTIEELRQEHLYWLDYFMPFSGRELFIQAVDVRESADRVLIAEHSRSSVWQLSTGELLWMGDMPGGDVSVAKLSPNGKVIAIGKKSGEVHLQRIP